MTATLNIELGEPYEDLARAKIPRRAAGAWARGLLEDRRCVGAPPHLHATHHPIVAVIAIVEGARLTS
jgi:hypothetical protein